jgi:hypothetical protein
LCADGCAANAVAEVLSKAGIVLLHSSRSRCIAIGQGAIDDVEALLVLVQSQLEVSGAGARVVLGAPLNIKDAVGSSATNRGEDPKPGV